jgi:hypothetical protein
MSYNPSGWGYYADSVYTESNKLSVNNALVQLTCDGLGAATETSYLPSGYSDFWAGDTLLPQSVGRAFEGRVQFKCESPGGPADWFDIVSDIGTPGTPIEISRRTVQITRDGENSISVSGVFFGGPTFYTNGGKLYFDSTPSGDNVSIWDISLLIKLDA